jgi:Asp-tRNA(Asn)/Glu-tRNA(Gln) amidotransferase A subunit family amidase
MKDRRTFLAAVAAGGAGLAAYATPAVDYIDAQRQRTLMDHAVHAAFGEYDAVISPTIPTVT